ncbi:hypothetical protein SHIRM173S_11786 [Streptomyces hirsutus]
MERPISRGISLASKLTRPRATGRPSWSRSLDRVARAELALDARDPGRQQRLAALDDRAHRAVVEGERALRGGRVLEPQQPVGRAPAGGVEVGAGVRAGEGVTRVDGAGQHDRDARGGGDRGGLDLGDHAAGADAGLPGAADLDVGEVLWAPYQRDPRGAGPGGVSVVHAVHVGQQDQQVGVDQVGDEGGETVVVAEADLVGGDGVVLVDDREGAHRQQLVEGAGGVAVVGAAAHVVGGEQYLADADAVAGEGCGVTGHQQTLADAGGGLLAGEVPRSPGEAQGGESGGDGTGGDEDEFALSPAADLREHIDECVDPVGVQAARRGRQRRGSDLDDDPAGLAHGLPCPCHLLLRPLVPTTGPAWAPHRQSTRSGAGNARPSSLRTPARNHALTQG